jgi:hypothetical protein
MVPDRMISTWEGGGSGSISKGGGTLIGPQETVTSTGRIVSAALGGTRVGGIGPGSG